jgi:hypothetical protein
LLVESDDVERDRLGQALEESGYEVIACPGPTSPGYTCIGSRQGYCPLIEQADVVVLDTWLAGDEGGIGTTADELLDLYTDRGRAVVTIGSGASSSPYAAGRVIPLRDRPDGTVVAAAVRSAPEADGFVLHGR